MLAAILKNSPTVREKVKSRHLSGHFEEKEKKGLLLYIFQKKQDAKHVFVLGGLRGWKHNGSYPPPPLTSKWHINIHETKWNEIICEIAIWLNSIKTLKHQSLIKVHKIFKEGRDLYSTRQIWTMWWCDTECAKVHPVVLRSLSMLGNDKVRFAKK